MQSLSVAERPASVQIQTAAAALKELSLPALSQDGMARPDGETQCDGKVNALDSVLDKEDFKLVQVRLRLLSPLYYLPMDSQRTFWC